MPLNSAALVPVQVKPTVSPRREAALMHLL
jgi:hypothetical protein